MKCLAVCTNVAQYKNGEPTGLWLSELVHVYDLLNKNGVEVVIASPAGGEIPLDPRSLGRFGLDSLSQEYLEDENFMALLSKSGPLNACDTEEFEAVFYAGGHGCMYDFPDNQVIARINRELSSSGKIISAVCHGVAALFDKEVVSGKQVTGYTWPEEILAGKHNIVPFSNQEKFSSLGAIVKNRWLPFVSHVVVDGNLITGQNPQSSKKLARVLLSKLK